MIRALCFLFALLGLCGCSALGVINGLTPSDTYLKTDGVAYGDDVRQRLDIYQPSTQSAAQTSALPVVVFFYGGSWNSGQRSDYTFVGEALAARGIVTVIADYRIYPQVKYPGFVEDAARAVAWTLRNIPRYGGDPKRVFVMGHSAGAYNAAMVALDARWLKVYQLTPQDLRGWIGLAGPYNFLPIENPAVKPIFFYPDTPLDSQPIQHASAASPRAFLAAAQNDTTVNPQRNTAQLARQLRSVGVVVTERIYPDVSHGSLVGAFSVPLRGLAPVLSDVENFVRGD